MENPGKSRGPKKKMRRVSEARELSSICDTIHQKWINTDATLKELRDKFNKAVLEAAMEQNGMNVAPGEVEYTYSALFKDKETSITDKEEVKMRLEENGINISSVTDDFINSPQTILNYLRDEYDVDRVRKQPGDKIDPDQVDNYIKPLNRRYENVVSSMVERLSTSGQLEHDNFDVTVECVVTDKKSNESRPLSDLIAQ
jgi:hypothetical protein